MPSTARLPLLVSAALTLAAAVAGTVFAQPAQDGTRRGPPPEAIAACKGLSEGTKVSFKGPQGEDFAGTCEKTPDGTLAARPAGAPPPQKR